MKPREPITPGQSDRFRSRLDQTIHRDTAAELGEDSIARIMIDAPAAPLDGAGQAGKAGALGGVGGILVGAGEPGLAGHVGKKNRRQLALYRLLRHVPPPRVVTLRSY